MAGSERLFQRAFVAGLQKNGWVYSGSEGSQGYDKGSAIIPSDLRQWVKLTQVNAWNQLVLKSGNEENALKLMVEDITKFRRKSPAKGGGTYNLLLHGLKIRNVQFHFFQNKPVSLASPAESWKLYDNMIFRVISELYYSQSKPRDAIDLGFFINGIPLGTSELKAVIAGQGVGHAEKQYKNDRIPGLDLILHPSAGALFHIAAADNLASLTTSLNGKDTYFIPFNTGIDNTEWQKAHPSDYSVSYLWDDVLKKENISQIIFTTMRNMEVNDIWQTRFPRYHQFDNLRKLIDAVLSEHGDKNYLSQHAPGSGKSDEIANLAYALSNLQDDKAKPIYSKVIVVTNRTVLDDQINKLIQAKMINATHFKHIHKDNDNSYISKSKILSDELVSRGGSRILAVTAQTFSNTLLSTIQELKAEGQSLTGRFAIIVDEAHDGETGRQHQNMYRALLGVSLDEITTDSSLDETPAQKAEDELSFTVEEDRKLLPSLNFFAYTATPNADALRVFGEPVEDEEGLVKYKPFHAYSMHQAREEGYINDVLENYVTHDRFINIVIDGKEYKGDKIVDFREGKKKVGEWLQTLPEVKKDIVDIVVTKMSELVVPLINGEGKAMLTCSSRLDAVTYKRLIDAEIAKLPKEKQFGTLVAFSGSVYDSSIGKDVTELDPALNFGLTQKDIAKQFESTDFRLLIVADKYQVGFDQPKLACMFLDKSLRGINLVQTTARVNRKIKGKDKVYIFDFANKREEVQEAFAAFDEDATLSLDQDLSTKTLDKLIISANSARVHLSASTSAIPGTATYWTDDGEDNENDVEGYEKAIKARDAVDADEKCKAIATIRMSSIINRCVAKFNKDLGRANSARVDDLHKYRITLKRFVSIYNLLSITRSDTESIHALYGEYGGYAMFFNAMSKALTLSRVDPDPEFEVDVNALRLKEYKVVEDSKIKRTEDEDPIDTTGGYGDSIQLGSPTEKKGPIEVLIEEINVYPELSGQSKEDVKNFVDAMVQNLKDDSTLKTLADDNSEESFSGSNGVRNKILRQFSRESKNKIPNIQTIAKELIKKQEHDSTVISGFAKMLHRTFTQPKPDFSAPVLTEPVYIERTEHKDSPLRVHHLATAGYLHDGMPLVSTDDRFPVEGAVIKAAAIYVHGLSHPDPSTAANRVRRSFGYMEDNANGWYFWGIKDGNGTVVPLGDLLDKVSHNG